MEWVQKFKSSSRLQTSNSCMHTNPLSFAIYIYIHINSHPSIITPDDVRYSGSSMAKASSGATTMAWLLVLLLVASLQLRGQFIMASRPVHGEERWRHKIDGLLLQSLPQGTVPLPGRSGCTHSPNNNLNNVNSPKACPP